MFDKQAAFVFAVVAAVGWPCAAVRLEGPSATTRVNPGDNAAHKQSQVNLLCNEGSGDAVAGWNLTNSGNSCGCECDFEDCFHLDCPEGYIFEQEECVRYETETGEVVPATKEELTCPEGELKVHDGRVICSIAHGCPPPPPSSSGSARRLLPAQGCDKCDYDVTCDGQAMEIRHGVPFCVKPAVVTETTKRITADPIQVCPDGSELSGGMCRKNLPQCPVEIVLPPEAIACGPVTDLYIERMIVLLGEEAKKFKDDGSSNTLLLSCSSTCSAVFSKASECAEQNDAIACVGRAARSGAGIEAIGQYCSPDGSPGAPEWLKRVSKGKHIPCKDMYGSEYNLASGGWQAAVEKAETMAVKHYILLTGTYIKQPMGRLDCRTSSCKKVNSYIEQQKGDKALKTCLTQCVQQYR